MKHQRLAFTAKAHSRPVALLLFAAVATLAACNGNGTSSYSPSVPGTLQQQPQDQQFQDQQSAVNADPALEQLARALPNASSLLSAAALAACHISTLPGTYATIISSGNVVSGTYTGIKADSIWITERYVSATPSPTPKPTPTPTPPPPYYVYLYSGTYTTNISTISPTATLGCALLITTQSGKPIPKTTYNGTAVGAPSFNHYYHTSTVLTGPISPLTVHNLSSTGGTGSGTLLTSLGAKLGTVSITLTTRTLVLLPTPTPTPTATPTPQNLPHMATVGGASAWVTSSGYTLYEFTADGYLSSNCTLSTYNGCSGVWPPLAAPSGATASGSFTPFTRSNGTRQWAYLGHPLYTYSGDSGPYQTHGNGLVESDGKSWSIARPAGVTPTPSPTPGSTPTPRPRPSSTPPCGYYC
jgi:predicted lipoprotein with Yx(FWY)xxD motif